VKIVVTMESSNKRMGRGSARTVDRTDDECKHEWKEIGTLVFYEAGAPTMPSSECYSGHLKTDKLIAVLKCEKCREVKFQFSPWNIILGGKKDV